jgi:hypothetical protein
MSTNGCGRKVPESRKWVKTPKEIDRFNQWSLEWKAERRKSDLRQIVRLWQQPIPNGWEREVWKGKLGYRKVSSNRGEQIIESQLLSDKFEHLELMFSGREPNAKYRIRILYHNMPLANQRSGQVIADAFGILETGKSARPLFIEVKTTADDPRGVSTTLRHMLTEFSEFFHVSWIGLLIHASVGTAGGLGALRTKRSG